MNAMPPAALRVFIRDGHSLIRDGLAARIAAEGNLTICGVAGSIQEVLSDISDGSNQPYPARSPQDRMTAIERGDRADDIACW